MRLRLGAATLTLGFGLTAFGIVDAGELWPAVAAVAGLGLLLLLVALVRRSALLVPWALATLGGAYATSLLVRESGIDDLAPFYAGGFVVLAELAYWTLERPVPGADPELLIRRLVLLAGMFLAAVFLGVFLLVGSEFSPGGGVALEALGVAAAVAALALVARLAWRVRGDRL